jgi:hypothetical protein
LSCLDSELQLTVTGKGRRIFNHQISKTKKPRNFLQGF